MAVLQEYPRLFLLLALLGLAACEGRTAQAVEAKARHRTAEVGAELRAAKRQLAARIAALPAAMGVAQSPQQKEARAAAKAHVQPEEAPRLSSVR